MSEHNSHGTVVPATTHAGSAPVRALAGLLVLAMTTGCRDGIAPYAPQEDAPRGDTYQLTYNPTRDFAPTWSGSSDTVFYTTAHFPATPFQTTLIRVGLPGRSASLLAPNAQPDSSLSHVAAGVESPDRSRIAYLHIPLIDERSRCGTISAPPGQPPQVCALTEPKLTSGFLRVRARTDLTRATSDVKTDITFAGAALTPVASTSAPYEQRVYPYQMSYRSRGEFLSRPSWSPDGNRIVFSDGLNLRVWQPSQSESIVIPNSTDGVTPAWSPTRDEVAFTRIIRVDSTSVVCGCVVDGADVNPVINRWIYTVSRRVITVIQPDGSRAVEIGEGEDPAWSPDGSMLYFATPAGIYRVSRAGGTPVAVPNTEGGRSPAVSPDGKWLAFTRADQDLRDINVWITRLGAQ